MVFTTAVFAVVLDPHANQFKYLRLAKNRKTGFSTGEAAKTGQQCKLIESAKSIYVALAELETSATPTLSFAAGFPAADFPDCGPSVIAYGETQADADAAAARIARRILECEAAYNGRIFSPDKGVRLAMKLAADALKPIVIADTQDNPGAGGDSDTTGMLRALLDNDAENAALGLIVDPAAAEAAHAAGVGRAVTLALGGKSGIHGDAPLAATFVVEALSDGRFVAPGPFYGGTRMNIGLSACLRIGGVRIVVASRKAQLADQAMFRQVGIEPPAPAILVNKSSVHFRADISSGSPKLS